MYFVTIFFHSNNLIIMLTDSSQRWLNIFWGEQIDFMTSTLSHDRLRQHSERTATHTQFLTNNYGFRILGIIYEYTVVYSLFYY